MNQKTNKSLIYIRPDDYRLQLANMAVLIPFYFIDINVGNIIKVNKTFFLILAYVIFFPGIFSFFFWIKGVALIGANRAGVYLHLMPILGAIMAMIIFGEKIMLYHFLGAIFIIAGILVSNRTKTTN